MITDHAIHRNLQRHRHQDRYGDGEYSEKKYPGQVGITRLCQLEEAFKKDGTIGVRAIGQCVKERPPAAAGDARASNDICLNAVSTSGPRLSFALTS